MATAKKSTQGRAQFTPGPWVVDEDYEDEEQQAIGIVKEGRGYIAGIHILASCNNGEGFTAEDRANAHLIAAAPAMYEALQNLLEWAKGNRGAREGNPYCKPEVRQALKVLASIQDKKDYIDADTAPQAEGR